MFKKTLFFVFTLCISFSAFSQNESDSIQITKKSGAYVFTLHGEVLSLRKLDNIMINNAECISYLKKANTSTTLGQIVSFAGGFMIGYSLAPVLRSESPNLGLTFLGGIVTLISIPISLSAYKNMYKAVRIYNNGVSSLQNESYKINVGVNQNGLALVIRF